MKLRRSYERACRGTGLRFLGPSLVELAMEMGVERRTGKTVAANGQLIDKCASDVNDESSAQRATGNQLTRARSDMSLVP